MNRLDKLLEYKNQILEEIENAENEEKRNQWLNALKSIEQQEKEFKEENIKISLYSENENYKLYHGSMLDMLEVIEEESIDSIITDPPYELNFMNKGWDNTGVAFQKETWEKCYKALKMGGYLLAFGGSRTFHRIACAIEDAGFEIRDTIMWLYGSGFPKSLNVGLAIDKRNGVESKVVGKAKGSWTTGENDVGNKVFVAKNQYEDGTFDIKEAQNEWKGWGTQLKPSYEPIIVARKPVEKTIVDNVLKYGVGGINIDECRIETNDELYRKPCENGSVYSMQDKKYTTGTMNDSYKLGRYPANTILTYDETDFNEVCGGFPKEENGSASRYFYCAKASKKDRDDGLDDFEEKTAGERTNRKDGSAGLNAYVGATYPAKNIHPTVKPMELMQYLVRLISPNGATILDCFNGSGSTGKAVMYENAERNKNYKYIGIELTEEYLPISKARIESVLKKGTQTRLF